MSVLIIAEAGVNHNGDLGIAKELIAGAKDCGADVVKFQTWVTEELLHASAPKALYQKENDKSSSQFEMLKKLELSFDAFQELKEYATKLRIKFMSTPDEEKSLNFLVDSLQMETIKVGSGEVLNLPYLKKVGEKKKEVILSTGMASLGEVERAYYTLLESGAVKVSLLHCTSAYPAPYDSVNLKAMLTLKEAFKTDVGYSDHTRGNEVSIAAVALGATIIEKHFTLNSKMEGPDHQASSNPQEFADLVRQIRNVELAISGDGIKRPQGIELETKKIVSKGIYAARDLEAHAIISMDDLKFLRPQHNGLAAENYELIIGKEVQKPLKKGQEIALSNISL